MNIPSLLILAIALGAIYIRMHVAEELIQLGATLIALICLFLGLVSAPFLIKVIIVTCILAAINRTSLAIFNSNSFPK